MTKKKRQGHYCRICGQWKANEKFSGKGHAAHICKACASLPIERKNELQRINKVERIAEKFRLTKEEWDLLEKYSKNNKYPELKEYAADVLAHHRQMKEDRKPQIEEVEYGNLEEELKEEIAEILYDDLLYFITEEDVVPNEKQLKKIIGDISAAYQNNFYLRIIPDDSLNGQVQRTLKTVIADLRDEGAELE